MALLAFMAGCPKAAPPPEPPVTRRVPPPPPESKGPVTLAADQASPTREVAVDGANVFWTDDQGRLWRAPKRGGRAVLLANDEVKGIALGEREVFYATRSAIRRVAKRGGPSTTLAAEPGVPVVLIADQGELYYTTLGGDLKRLAPGGAPTRVAGAATNATLAVDEAWIYVSVYGPGRILRLPKQGGSAETIVTGEKTPVSLAVDATHVYFATERGGTVKRAPKAGGPVETLAAGQFNHEPIALDDGHVYWADWAEKRLVRVAKTGGALETLASGLMNPSGLAVDDAWVYVASRRGTIQVVEKNHVLP